MLTETTTSFDYVAVTPADSDITEFRALYIGTAGDVVVKSRQGSTVTFANVPAGSILPVQGLRVTAATTADDIVALY